MKIGALIVLFFSALFAKGQTNLVPNPSFEDYSSCPTFTGDFSLTDWFNPNNNSPDYYNACCTIPYPGGADVPKNFRGFQYPRTGNGYTGIHIYTHNNPNNGRDYISCKLNDTLDANQPYCVTLYLSLSNTSTYSIYDIAIYFSNTNPYYFTDDNLPYLPQIVTNRPFNDTLNWMKFEYVYFANGGETYFTIGNFKDNVSTRYDSLYDEFGVYAYYYIDDVSVIECEPPKPELTMPNVFTPNNDGHNDVLIFENLPEQSSLSIYNRWGNLMYSHRNYANDWRADNVSDGVYFYILKLPNGESKHGTLQIIR